MRNPYLLLTVCVLCAGNLGAQDAGAGRVLFENRCARCHGADGNGGELGPRLGKQECPRRGSDAQRLIFMGKLIPRSFERLRSGEQIQIPTFTNVAAANAAGVTAAKFPRRVIYLSAGGTGSVPCLAVSDGTNWRQVAIGANAI